MGVRSCKWRKDDRGKRGKRGRLGGGGEGIRETRSTKQLSKACTELLLQLPIPKNRAFVVIVAYLWGSALSFSLFFVIFSITASKASFYSARGIIFSRVHNKNVPARIPNKGKLNEGPLLASGYSL